MSRVTLQEAMNHPGYWERTMAGNPKYGHIVVRMRRWTPDVVERLVALDDVTYRPAFRAYFVKGTTENAHALQFIADQYGFTLYPLLVQYLEELTSE